MKLRILLAVCDACPEHEHVPGETFGLAVNGAKPTSVELCEPHRKEFLDPLLDLIAAHGAPMEITVPRPKRPSENPDKVPLPVIPCPMGDTSRAGLQSLMQHVKGDHGFDFGPEPAVKFYGVTCPICGGGPFRKIAHHGQYSHPEVVGGAQALYEEAIRIGDPHGLAAKNEKRLRAMIRKGGSYVEEG